MGVVNTDQLVTARDTLRHRHDLFVTTVTPCRPPSRGALHNLLRIWNLSGTSRFRWNCLIRRLWSALGDLNEQGRWPGLGNALPSVQSPRLWDHLPNYPVGRFASQSMKNVTTCNHIKNLSELGLLTGTAVTKLDRTAVH